jgi:hypothetical protein
MRPNVQAISLHNALHQGHTGAVLYPICSQHRTLSAQHGHPGQHVELGGNTYVPISYPPMEDCCWSTQGWIYQEAVLSRRRIIFFRAQVYFRCYRMVHLESVRTPLANLFKKPINHLGYLFPSILLRQTPRQHLLNHINTYIARDTKYENGVLPGLVGILQWFSELYDNSIHLTGLLLLRNIQPH